MRFLRLYHLRSLVYRRTVEFLQCTLAHRPLLHADTKTYCRDRLLPYNQFHHSHPNNHDSHRNGNLLEYITNWHIGIDHHDKPENLFTFEEKLSVTINPLRTQHHRLDTYCKTVRRICLHNHFYDCTSNSNRCISDHWHNEIDLIDIWHPDNHPHHGHYGNPSNHHIFFLSVHMDQLFVPLWMESLRLVLRSVCRRVDICDRLDVRKNFWLF